MLQDLLSPEQCWAKYLRQDEKAVADDCGVNEDDMEEDGDVVVPPGPMAVVKEGFNKATGTLFDLLLDLVSGKHFADCSELASHSGGVVKALLEVDSSKDLEFLKQLKLATEMFEGSSKSVTASSAAPAPSLLNQLTTARSVDGEGDVERERHWKTIQGERRKFVSFGVPKAFTKDGILASYRACGKVFAHSGILNSSHKLLCASADLVFEQGDEPWLTASVPPTPLWKEIVGFLASSATGPADFVMAFDGRMREMRRVNVAWTEGSAKFLSQFQSYH